jgi:2-methylisocitrate lyase-like PEP mutase family enzyme
LAHLREPGHRIGVYPLTPLNAAIQGMQTAWKSIRPGETATHIIDFVMPLVRKHG